MITNAEVIGAGPLWQGMPHPSGNAEYPPTYPTGTAIGQHLRVERLLRVSENRHYYLVNNLGPKWNRRKCWACGNKYSPNTAQSCDFCLTPLRDLRFIMTARWNRDEFVGSEQFVKAKVRFFGLVTPVTLIYRNDFQLAVYHYHGEQMLLDEPAPLPTHALLAMAHQLGEVLHQLHDRGVVLRRLGRENVLMMPDGSVRLFDVDAYGVLGSREALANHRRRPIQADTRRLGELLLSLCAPQYEKLQAFFSKAITGEYDNPGAFSRDVEKMLFAGGARAVDTVAASFADVGLLRDHNEDSWGWRRIDDDVTAYVLADGMGGHEAGEVASQLSVDAALDSLVGLTADPKKAKKKVALAVEAANHVVMKSAKEQRVKMGTTIVVLVVLGNTHLVVGNAGDSRAYLFRLGTLEQISRDHSIVAELVAAGKLTREQARTHKNSHILTSTVGAEEDLEYDVEVVECQPGDRVLICSDGLWGEVPDDELAYHLGSQPDRRHCVQALVRAAYEEGGKDNISVQVVDVQ